MRSGLVSVIMPVFNRESLIGESLNSVLGQSYQDWECLIVDDDSTDGTESVALEYVEKDSRIKYFKRPSSRTKGANSCRNYGLEMSSGCFIHWFDSDDIAHPRYLEISLELLNQSNADFCRFGRSIFSGNFHYNFKRYKISDIEITEVGKNHIEALLTNDLVFNTCNVLWRRASLGSMTFNERIVYADEWEFYSRLLANGLEGVSIESELFFGRKHRSSTTFEYATNSAERKTSKIKAVMLVMENLRSKNLMNRSLKKFFVRTGFELNNPDIINRAVANSDTGFWMRFKYKCGYKIYPVLRPFLKLKGKIYKWKNYPTV